MDKATVSGQAMAGTPEHRVGLGRVIASAAVIVGILAFVFLARITAARMVREFPSVLASDARAALEEANLPLEGVTFDGRDAHLSGPLAAPDVFGEAEVVLASVAGVGGVSRDEVPALTASLRIEVTDAELRLEGRIPSHEVRMQLDSAGRRAAGTRRTTERLIVEPGVARPAWLSHAGQAMAALTQAGTGVIRLEQGALTVRGTVPSAEARQGFLGTLRAVFPTLDITDDLTVVRGPSEVQDAIDEVIAGRRIAFDASGTELTEETRTMLNDLARVLVQFPTAHLRVAMNGGSVQRDRSQRVKDYLVRRGVRSDRISAVPDTSATDGSEREFLVVQER